MEVRIAAESEFEHLARLWHDGWWDAHAQILPRELARHRTLESFEHRLRSSAQHLRVIGPMNHAVGLCITKGDELNQLYVSGAARGGDVALALLNDGEMRIRNAGWRRGWLACAIGNNRAARFYEKSGWLLARVDSIELETPEGMFPLIVWRYEKSLSP